jgi:ATP-dependent DNA helicase RecQ
MPQPLQLLREVFGLEHFRPGQETVISHLLAGRSAAAVFPTGGGKSLCYQLPALTWPGLTVVVSPLIALMKEQIDRLQARHIAADRLDSTRTSAESGDITRKLRDGSLRLLYVAPERFNNERFRELLLGARVSLFAIDEAHCISEWGHSFRPDYLKLANFARVCQAERTLALTATATPQVLDDICAGFGIDPACAVRTGFYRPNLTLVTTPTSMDARDALLCDRLQQRVAGPTIVYVTLQRTAEEVASRLAEQGLPARHYHAGMKDEERVAVQEWFAGSEHCIVVATIAFGMGIDKANIRAVYHYNVPKSLENLAQEIGRAGRDGLASTCEMFLCAEDLNALENFAFGDTPTPEAVAGMVREVFGLGEEFSLSLSELSYQHDIRPLVLNTLLTYLELEGYLQAGTPYYNSYRFKPLVSSQEMLARFSGERRTFLTQVFRQATKSKIWYTLDLDRAARASAAPRERIVRALDYLEGQGLLELKVEGVRHRFRRLKMPPDLERVAQDLHQRTLAREKREIGRLQQVLALVGHAGCQVSRLGEHFGEPLGSACGHCSWCLAGQQPCTLPPRPVAHLDPALWNEIKRLRTAHSPILDHPRSLARLLCGLSSPRLSRARLTRDPLCGSLAHVPFRQVLGWAEERLRGRG